MSDSVADVCAHLNCVTIEWRAIAKLEAQTASDPRTFLAADPKLMNSQVTLRSGPLLHSHSCSSPFFRIDGLD